MTRRPRPAYAASPPPRRIRAVARPEPPGRVRRRRAGRRASSARATTTVPARRTPRSRRCAAQVSGPAERPPTSPSSPARTPVAPVRARTRSSRRGSARVVFAQSDPNRDAAGGAERLHAAGVDVIGGVLADEAGALNERWARDRRAAAGRWSRGSSPPPSTGAAPRPTARASGSRARRPAPTCTPCGRPATPSWWARAPCSSTTPASRPVCRMAGSPSDSRSASSWVCVTCPRSARVHDGPGEVLHLRTRDPERRAEGAVGQGCPRRLARGWPDARGRLRHRRSRRRRLRLPRAGAARRRASGRRRPRHHHHR